MSLAAEHTFEKKGNMGVLQVIKLLVLPSDSRFVREEFLKRILPEMINHHRRLAPNSIAKSCFMVSFGL